MTFPFDLIPKNFNECVELLRIIISWPVVGIGALFLFQKEIKWVLQNKNFSIAKDLVKIEEQKPPPSPILAENKEVEKIEQEKLEYSQDKNQIQELKAKLIDAVKIMQFWRYSYYSVFFVPVT